MRKMTSTAVADRNAHRTGRRIGLAVATVAAAVLVGCSTMPATPGTTLSEPVTLRYSEDGAIGRYRLPVKVDLGRLQFSEVQWRASEAFTPEERAQLATHLQSALDKSVKAVQPAAASGDARPVLVRATVTRVETVSPAANVLSTLLVLVPLDRGGAAVEIEALDAQSKRPLAALSYASYAPLSDFGARFSRLAPAELALGRAADEFVALLVTDQRIAMGVGR